MAVLVYVDSSGRRYYAESTSGGTRAKVTAGIWTLLGGQPDPDPDPDPGGGTTTPAPNASTTVRGLVELATIAETLAGIDALRAVTPSGLKAVTDSLPGGGTGEPTDSSGLNDFGVAELLEDPTSATRIAGDLVFGKVRKVAGVSPDANGNVPLDFIPASQKGAANGVPTLDATGRIPGGQLPSVTIREVYVVANQAARLALSQATVGAAVIQQTPPSNWMLQTLPASNAANWVQLADAVGVASINGQTGVVVIPADGAANVASLRTLGTGPGTAAAGNDGRFGAAALKADKSQPNGYPGLDANGQVVDPIDASKVTSGVFDDARLPGDLVRSPSIETIYVQATDPALDGAVGDYLWFLPDGTTPGGGQATPVVDATPAAKGVLQLAAKSDLMGTAAAPLLRTHTLNERQRTPKLTALSDKVIGTRTQIGLSTIYVPWLIRVTDEVFAAFPQYGRWRCYTSTDHDASAGGIAIGVCMSDDIEVSANWTWLRNSGSAVMFKQDNGAQVETPCVVWNPDTALFHLYFQAQYDVSGQTVQVTRVATSADGVTGWTVVGDAIPNLPSTVAGWNHTGYARVYYLDGIWAAWHLQGSGSSPGVSAYGWSWSNDGLNFIADRRRVGAAVHMTDGALRLGISSLITWRGELWAIGTMTEYVSGATGSSIRKSYAAPIDITNDLRSFKGRPTLICPTTDPGPPTAFAQHPDGRLFGAIRVGPANSGSLALAVLS